MKTPLGLLLDQRESWGFDEDVEFHQNSYGDLVSKSEFELYRALEAAMNFIESHVADPDITNEMSERWNKLQLLNPEKVLANARGR